MDERLRIVNLTLRGFQLNTILILTVTAHCDSDGTMSHESPEQLQAVINSAYDRFQDEDAQSMNLVAGQALGEATRTTLGPNGMDKMIVDSLGGVTITNDGATILQEMDLDHPAAELVSEVAQSQERAAGDGTTTAVVLASELLAQAEKLIDDGIHPTSIINGYRTAISESYDVLDDNATEVTPEDDQTLSQLAQTAMTGTGAEGSRKHLADLVVEAVRQVSTDGIVDTDAIQIESVTGGLLTDSECILGTTIEKEPAALGMERLATDAKIGLFEDALQIENTKLDGSVSFDDPDTRQQVLDTEDETLITRVQKLTELDVDVVFAGGELGNRAIEEMVQRGIMVFNKTPTEALERLAGSTGATISTGADALTPEKLGYAGHVECGAKDWQDVVFVEECKDPDNVTLLLRGGPTHVMDELKRPIADAIAVVSNAVENGRFCPGGCAIEIEIARRLRSTAGGIAAREQLAVDAFADAIEVLPRTLAESAGRDPIDTLVELRQRHAEGDVAAGVNGHAGEIEDTRAAGVIDSVRVKETAIETAAQAAILLLRIDDILLSEQQPDRSEGGTAPGMPR